MTAVPHSLIPAPSRYDARPGHFRITADAIVTVRSDHEETIRIADELAGELRQLTGFPIPLQRVDTTNVPAGALYITDSSLAPGGSNPEGYLLEISTDSVRLSASTPAGVFYGVQSLRQLLTGEIPAARIEDHPRFEWRGLLLDCCRHFLAPEYVKRIIDRIARCKMNRFHWHLTEDQGWRIEIGAHPRLTDIGSWRTGSDGSRIGGHYSRQTIREIVDYAARRHVTVVPEIEMPGHAMAALAAYPALSCTGGPFEVETGWGIFEDVFCAGNDDVFSFLEDVLDEVFELFPGEYLHLGGDECPKTRWKACHRCQSRIRDEGLRDENELQAYFIRRIVDYVRSRGKRPIGWDEILEGGLADGAIVQSWRDFSGAAAAVKLGHDAILSPTSHAYFDYPLQNIDLRQAYSFEPIPAGLTPEEEDRILGGECNMWTERAPEEEVDGKLFPRILAIAERLWSPAENQGFADFHRRVQDHYPRLDALGVNYGPETESES